MKPIDGAAPPEAYAKLDELADALRRLHKILLDAEAAQFGPIAGPFELLKLALHHEHFAWLRSLSELMVEIDEARDAGAPADRAALAAFKTAVEELVGPRAPKAAPFRERYTALLQQTPAAAMAHGDLRRVLDKLPNPAAAPT